MNGLFVRELGAVRGNAPEKRNVYRALHLLYIRAVFEQRSSGFSLHGLCTELTWLHRRGGAPS